MSEMEHLGPYRLGSVIGRGGMGSVYSAKHVKSGDEVAVKLIAQHVADDQRFRRRFAAEVETLKRLRHPGIVQLIGYGEEEGRLFYSMELVHGVSLQQRIREVKRLSWLPAVDIAIQICSALKHAHDIGVIHRDLKPANLLLTDAGEVKLVDFGIAKLFGFGEQTLAGSVLGTADYMAPEQTGSDAITPRTDLYALGSVMYAMMAGRAPFAGKKLTQVIESLKRDRAVPLDLINPEIPDEIVEIVHHLLEKVPKDRPPTALAVMKRLQATRAGLQRGKTAHFENESTRSGDASEPVKARGHGDTQHTQLTDAPHEAPPDSPTNKTGAGGRTGQRVVRGGSPSAASSVSAEDMPTVATIESALPSDGQFELADVPTSPPTQTHFQTVEAQTGEGGFLSGTTTKEPGSSKWLHVASVVGMVGILLAGLFLVARTLQTPSADSMFAELSLAQEASELTLREPAMKRFLEAYPDDPRAIQVSQWERETDLVKTLRRLLANARAAGGVSRLEPAEQAFVEAMNLRETSGEQATEHLQAWLDVFSPSVDESASELNQNVSIRERLEHRSHKKLRQLASEELERLEQTPFQEKEDTRLKTLQSRLELAETLSPEARQRLLSGLIRLYRNDPWAKPIVAEAAARLKAEQH